MTLSAFLSRLGAQTLHHFQGRSCSKSCRQPVSRSNALPVRSKQVDRADEIKGLPLLETTLGKMVFTPGTPFICWKASVGRYGRLLTRTIQSRSESGADNATVDGDRGDPLCTIANVAPFCLGLIGPKSSSCPRRSKSPRIDDGASPAFAAARHDAKPGVDVWAISAAGTVVAHGKGPPGNDYRRTGLALSPPTKR